MTAFARALTFEASKLRSLRSTTLTLSAVAVLLPLMAVIVAATGSLQADDTIVGGSLTGATVAELIAASLGAVVVTSEYRWGTMRSTLAAVPIRARVFTAKATVVAAALFAVTLPAAAAGFGLGAAMLDRNAYETGEPIPTLFGVALSMSVLGVLGVAIGTLVRHSAGAIATVVGVILVPTFFAPLFGDAQRWIGGASPTGALEKMTQTADASHETVGSLGAWPALGIVASYTAVAAAVAVSRFRSRDA